MDEYSLWKVAFSYESPGEHVGDREREIYTVIAQNKEEAESKALADFKETSAYIDLNLSRDGLVKTRVQQLKKQKIRFPYLTLGEDQEHFSIIPQLSRDHSSLEYIVTERKGK